MGFYDFKGYWRNDGEGFYDGKGYFRSPGEGFYDGKGYFRSPGEGFYDGKGYFRSPGEGFYDGKGYFGSSGASVSRENTPDNGVAIGFVLLVPFVVLCFITEMLVSWISSHFYLVFWGYAIVSVIFNFVVTKSKQHKGTVFALSYFGNYLCILSLFYIVLAYAAPYVYINGENIWSMLEFLLVTAFGCGGVIIVQFINYCHKIPFLEFIIGVLFFALVIIIIKNNVDYTIEELAKQYNVNASVLFKILFGFVV